MMKKLLSIFTVLLLVSLLAVSVFAADAKNATLAISSADGTALVPGETVDVYIVLSPAKAVSNSDKDKYYGMVYRPTNSTKPGDTVTSGNSDILEQSFAIEWDSAYFSLQGTVVGTTEAGKEHSNDGSTKVAAYLGSSAADLYWSAAVKGDRGVSPAVENTERVGIGDDAGKKFEGVTIAYSEKFTCHQINIDIKSDTEESFNYSHKNAIVAKLTFYVKNPGDEASTKITLADSHKCGKPNNNNNTTDNGSAALNLTVAAAGCNHLNEEGKPNASGDIELVDSTCISAGSMTFTCADCGEKAVIEIEKKAHKFEKEDGEPNVVVTLEPTCTTNGSSEIRCVSCEKAVKENSETEVPALGHVLSTGEPAWKHVVVSLRNCVDDGKAFYYCAMCHGVADVYTSETEAPATDADVKALWFYNPENSRFYEKAEFTDLNIRGQSEMVSGTALGISPASGHKIEKVSGKYTCTNSDTCEPFVRYVGATSKGNGETNTTYTDYVTAIDYFADIASILPQGVTPNDIDCKIIIVEGQKANISKRVVSVENAVASSFEEKHHTAHITVTSENPLNKSGIHFLTGCTSYFLYGDMTFENITISAEFTSGLYLAARSFKLIMGEGIETLGDPISSTKGSVTVKIPDVKLYIIAGAYKTGLYSGYNPDYGVNNYVEVHSGTYWAIYRYNRERTDGFDSCKSYLYLGDVTVETITTNTDTGNINNSHALVIYDGVITVAKDYFFTGKPSNKPEQEGSGNSIVRIFRASVAGSKYGTIEGTNVKNCGVATDVYYDTAVSNDNFVKNYVSQQKACIDAGYQHTAKSDFVGRWCSTYSADFFGTTKHVKGSDGKCAFCGVTFCENDKHDTLVEEIILAPTCSDKGYSNLYCADCYTYTAKNKELAPVEDAHGMAWVDGVRKCKYCGLITSSESVPAEYDAIYVSSKNATKEGGFTPENPTNFDLAINYAANAENDVTIYILDRAVVPSVKFVEPEHSNVITIRGYENKGIFEIGGGEYTTSPMHYILSGPVKFENVEFSTGDSYKNKAYIEARHNELYIGENVSADIKNNNDTESSRICVLGGCYKNSHCTDSAGNSDVTICSGTYNSIFAGSVAGGCKTTGTLNLKLYGDIFAKEFVHFGSFSLNAKVANIELRGTLSCNSYINFGSYGDLSDKKDPMSEYKHKATNINIYLYGGTMISQTASSAVIPLGSILANRKNTDAISGKLTVYYDPANASTVTLVNRIKDGADTEKLQLKTMDADSYCEVKKGTHTAGATVETVAATCYGEGYTISTCSACEKNYTSATADVIAHTKANEYVIPATCVSAGLKRYTCTNDGCNAVIFEIDPSAPNALTGNLLTDHNFDEKTGICVDCNANKTVVCGGIGHNYIETTVTASCGVGKAYECTVCGHTKVDLESENHRYGAYTITVEPTETTPGVKTRTCKGCGKVDTALVYATDSLNTTAIATTANGGNAGLDVVTSKLNKYEKEALNALVNETVYGSEIKVSYEVKGNTVSNITYSIPVPEEYAKMAGVKIVVKDDDGKLHVVDFKIEKSYFVFNF